MISDMHVQHSYDRIGYCFSQIVELEFVCDFIVRRAKQLSFEGCEHHRKRGSANRGWTYRMLKLITFLVQLIVCCSVVIVSTTFDDD